MSLEIAIQQNTAAINALIEILKSGLGATIVSPDALEEQVLEEISTPAKKAKSSKKDVHKEHTPADQPVAEPVAEIKAPTYDETAAKVIEVANKKGRDVAAGLLAQFNAKKLKDVDPSDFPAVIAACELALS